MSWTIAMALATAQPNMAPIDIPYQGIPAFQAYTECVGERLGTDPRRGGDAAVLRQANDDARAACRAVREAQLARAIEAVSDEGTPLDTRTYRDRNEAREAIRRALDRFDSDFEIEGGPPPLATAAPVAPVPDSPGDRPVTTTEAVVLDSLDVSPRLWPAVEPYADCLSASGGIQRRRNGRVIPHPPGMSLGMDCSRHRTRARSDLQRLLGRLGVSSRVERAERAEATLAEIDRFYAASRPREADIGGKTKDHASN